MDFIESDGISSLSLMLLRRERHESKNKVLKLVVWITLMVTVISLACSIGGQIFGPKQGHWEGKPSVSFDVTTDGRIRDFGIVIPMGVDKCTITLEKEIDIETDGTSHQ